MNQKHTLWEKLKQYSLLATPLLTTIKIANGQIIYHDITPDLIFKDSIVGDSYTTPEFLDLDGDGSFDAEFAVWSSVQSNNGPNKVNLVGAKQFGPNGNAMMGYTNLFSASFCSTPLPLYCASALNSDWIIGATANFWAIPNTATLGTLVRSFKSEPPPNNFVGQWNNLANKYIGLRFFGGDGYYHYGWIRLDVSKSPASISVKDYGYETQSEVAIRAGDAGSVGVPTVDTSPFFNIFCDAGVVNIFVNDGNFDHSIVAITNALGQTLLTRPLSSKKNQIDLRDFGMGIYIVSVTRNNERFSKKVSLN